MMMKEQESTHTTKRTRKIHRGPVGQSGSMTRLTGAEAAHVIPNTLAAIMCVMKGAPSKVVCLQMYRYSKMDTSAAAL